MRHLVHEVVGGVLAQHTEGGEAESEGPELREVRAEELVVHRRRVHDDDRARAEARPEPAPGDDPVPDRDERSEEYVDGGIREPRHPLREGLDVSERPERGYQRDAAGHGDEHVQRTQERRPEDLREVRGPLLSCADEVLVRAALQALAIRCEAAELLGRRRQGGEDAVEVRHVVRLQLAEALSRCAWLAVPVEVVGIIDAHCARQAFVRHRMAVDALGDAGHQEVRECVVHGHGGRGRGFRRPHARHGAEDVGVEEGVC
mmetsp:Transcript_71377/g.184045  ORF Transcript_71377/g.184045 Transcript_71377/m.184045 type:complete len:260 (+) Transcript_71377:363-1142(+)